MLRSHLVAITIEKAIMKYMPSWNVFLIFLTGLMNEAATPRVVIVSITEMVMGTSGSNMLTPTPSPSMTSAIPMAASNGSTIPFLKIPE